MRRNKGVSLHLLRAYSKYGMGAFEFSSLEICTLPELDPREEFWIQELRSFERDKGYNIALKASGPGLLPQESRDKISKHRLTHKRKPFSDEARQRMSVAHQGVKRQPLSEETKKKISESRRGQKPSKETRQKMSLSHKKS
jgi:group I intron endonuclease